MEKDYPPQLNPTRAQYERYPYPPISALALPRRDQGAALSYELGTRLAYGAPAPHDGIRILVAGAGTFETLVVAQAHPRAQSITAVDLSNASISKLKTRLKIARYARFQKLPPTEAIRADLFEWSPAPGAQFDYILASNVLHHVSDPAALLQRLAGWLRPGGILRMVTYPKASRLWMRETGRWLTLCGLRPEQRHLKTRAQTMLKALPDSHPIRGCFESQQEIGTPTGLVDAFLHACENPLSPLEWKSACEAAALTLVGETQTETSSSQFLEELEPKSKTLDPWTKLQIMDDLLELCANPILWLRKESQAVAPKTPSFPTELPVLHDPEIKPGLDKNASSGFLIPSRIRHELAQGLRRADHLLRSCDSSLDAVLESLRTQSGPRVAPPGSDAGVMNPSNPSERILPGHSAIDYDAKKIMSLPLAWSRAHWDALEKQIGPGWKLESPGQVRAHGEALSDQAEWLQLKYGATQDWIPARLIRV